MTAEFKAHLKKTLDYPNNYRWWTDINNMHKASTNGAAELAEPAARDNDTARRARGREHPA